MFRKINALLVLALLLAACSGGAGSGTTAVRLNGVYAGVVNANGWDVGAIGIDVTTTGTRLNGAACFVGIDGSEACNKLTGTIQGHNVSFSVGQLNFSGTTDGNDIDMSFRGSGVTGTVYFERYRASSLSVLRPETAGTGAVRSAEDLFRDGLLGPASPKLESPSRGNHQS